MNMIVAVASNWGIGKGNDLLFHISADMKRFRALTGGGTVIMGRKTLDSMPGGKALPKRRNIVITRSADFAREDVEVAHSLEEAIAMVAEEDPAKVWVIGGGEIYKAMLPHCKMCYVTHIYDEKDCDTFFPDLSSLENWEIQHADNLMSDGAVNFQFVDYVNSAL
jgi:dihydrofolate reductase